MKIPPSMLMPAFLCAMVLASCADQGNHAPLSFDSTVHMQEDNVLQGRLRTAIDADGDVPVYQLLDAPTHGVVVVQANGTYTYTPPPDFHGSDEFTWRVYDQHAAGNSYRTRVIVMPVNDAPRLRGTPAIPGDLFASDAVLQTDGGFVVAGTFRHNGSTGSIALLRYGADGLLDAGFGGGDGIVTTPVGRSAFAYSLAQLPDGKFLVVGKSHDNEFDDVGSIVLTRHDADGSLDTSFGGGDGIATTPFSLAAYGYSLVLQPDGRIVVAGAVATAYYGGGFGCCFSWGYRIALLRYQPDGSLDTGFGVGGIVTTGITSAISSDESTDHEESSAYGVVLQPDGKLVVAGGTSNSGGSSGIALLRYLPDGSPDPGFGGNGIVTTAIGTADASGYRLILQPDGKLVVTGARRSGIDPLLGYPLHDIALLRYNADGSLDAGFGGGDGMVTTPVGIDSSGHSLALLPDGKLMVAGTSRGNDHVRSIALLRFNADGSPDSGFGADGIVTTPGGRDWYFGLPAQPLVLQPDGAAVVVGRIEGGLAPLRYSAGGMLDAAFGQVRTLRAGESFSVPFPGERIVDPDGDALTYTAKLESGAALPTWLSFAPPTMTLAGTVPAGSAGQTLTIRITATDPAGLSLSDALGLIVLP